MKPTIDWVLSNPGKALSMLESQAARIDDLVKQLDKRSLPHHRRFMAWVDELFFHLPEWAQDDIHSTTRLRKWLLVGVGYSEIQHEIDVSEMSPETITAVVSALRQATDDVFCRRVGDIVQCHVARSQAFKNLGQKRFFEIEQEMKAFALDKLQVDVEEMLMNEEAMS